MAAGSRAAERTSSPAQAQASPAQEPPGRMQALQQRLERYAIFRILKSTGEGYVKDEVPSRAAAMTYYGVFSLFPLILVFMSALGFVFQNSQQAQERVMDVILRLLPQGQNAIGTLISEVVKAKGVAAGVGIVTLLWSALGWFQVIDTNINRIWGVSTSRSFIKAKLFALLMVASLGAVALASFLANTLVSVLAHFTNAIPGSVAIWQVVVSLVSLLGIALVFFMLYRFTPRRDVQFADIWPAALATAIFWEVTRGLLAFYMQTTNMVSGYGSVGAAMALLFWIFIASNIVLSGAELAYAIAKERRHVSPEDELHVIAAPGEQPTPKFAPQTGGRGGGGPKSGEAGPGTAGRAPEQAGMQPPGGRGSSGRQNAPAGQAGDALPPDTAKTEERTHNGGPVEAPVAVLAGIGLGYIASRAFRGR